MFTFPPNSKEFNRCRKYTIERPTWTYVHIASVLLLLEVDDLKKPTLNSPGDKDKAIDFLPAFVNLRCRMLGYLLDAPAVKNVASVKILAELHTRQDRMLFEQGLSQTNPADRKAHSLKEIEERGYDCTSGNLSYLSKHLSESSFSNEKTGKISPCLEKVLEKCRKKLAMHPQVFIFCFFFFKV